MTIQKLEKYQGLTIYREGDTYFANNGPDALEAESLEDMKREIDRYLDEMDPPEERDDTPSLTPWWSER